MNNTELFEAFFQKYIAEKFPGADMTHPNIQRVKEILRAGFRGACTVKDEEILEYKKEISNKEIQNHNLQVCIDEGSKAFRSVKVKLLKGLKFYADQKGHGLFENDGSKKRTLGDHAQKILAEFDEIE